jgi:CelD/BcsL family acetyltransferase involved in cellulose biosynthesis
MAFVETETDDLTYAGQRSGELIDAKPKNEPVLKTRDGWTASVFTQWEFPDRILRAWDSMAHERGDVGIFLESGWFELWWSAMGRKGKLFVTVIEHAGEVKGIFPCWIAPGGRLEGLADDYHYDFLISESHRERTIDLFAQVVRRRTSGSAYFHRFPASSTTPSLLSKRLHRKLIPTGEFTRPAAPFIDISATSWTDYTAALHTKLKKNLRQCQRRAEEQGSLVFEPISRVQNLDVLLHEFFDVECRSWKGAQGTAIQCSDDTESLYRSVARWAMNRNALRLFTLRLNDQLLAFDFCIVGGRTLFGMKTGYDQQSASRLSPGSLLRYEVIRYVFESKCFDKYDLLGPCYPWKAQWTSETNTWTSVEVYPGTPRGFQEYFCKYGWKAPLKRSQRLVAWAKQLSGAKAAVTNS